MDRNLREAGFMKIPLFFVFAAGAMAQQSSASGLVGDPCSLADTGKDGPVTFACGIGKEQGVQILKVLNELLASGLDTGTIRAKLAELPRDIRQRQDHKGWPELTLAQISSITSAAIPFAGQKIQIVVPNPERDTTYLAEQLMQALGSDPAKWSGSVQNLKTSVPSTAPIPLGIELRVNELGSAAQSLGNSLVSIFGPFGVHAIVDPAMAEDQIEIRILAKPFFIGNPAVFALCRAKVTPQSSCPWSLPDLPASTAAR
jgi:hypothetical protein